MPAFFIYLLTITDVLWLNYFGLAVMFLNILLDQLLLQKKLIFKVMKYQSKI